LEPDDLEGDLLYLAGPMRGLPGFNYPAFNAAADRLRAKGFRVHNPVDHEPQDATVRHYVAADMTALSRCDGIALLPGWESSVGARCELTTAVLWLKLPVYDATDGTLMMEDLYEPLLPAISPYGAMHPTTKEFWGITKEMALLNAKKGQDYGTNENPLANCRASEAIGIPAWKGAYLRLKDKIKRLDTYCLKGKLANEGVEDSFIDTAVYSIIALLLFREQSVQAT